MAVAFDSADDSCAGATGEIAPTVAAPVACEPEAAVSPGSVTVSELAADGVTIAGEGFAPGSTVTLTVAGDDIAPATDEGGTDTEPPGESGDERGLPATGAAGAGLLATIAALLFVVGWAQVLLRRRRVME